MTQMVKSAQMHESQFNPEFDFYFVLCFSSPSNRQNTAIMVQHLLLMKPPACGV